MSAFTMIVIIGVLMILGGFILLATPLMTFISAGYFIIILFFILGIFGVVQGTKNKRYDKEFIFAVLSLIMGVVGLVVPGAAAINNYVLLYMAAAWFIIHGILSIIAAIGKNKQNTGAMVLGVAMGILELIIGGYSLTHPTSLAVSLGVLIGFYFIESGVNLIITGSDVCRGGNSLTVLFTVMGIMTIIGGLIMLATPLSSFLSIGHCIIVLFFLNGILGIVRAIARDSYKKDFYLAILSLVLGIIGFVVPGAAAMNNQLLLYLAGAWFLIHAVMTIITALESRKQGAEKSTVVIGVVLGVVELIISIYSVAHPAVLAISLGVLVSFYFIVSGINMILIGSKISRAVAITRAMESAEAHMDI